MIILDTNVISELMLARPHPIVLDWVNGQHLSELATTTINVAEIRYGLARLPPGRRRSDLDARFRGFAGRAFADRVLDFDRIAAEVYGDLVAFRERPGRPLEGFDGLIAAIAKSPGLPLATRNIADFADCGITVISPWRSAAGNGERA
jgi:predicted nucleic acid-binding protein